MSHQRAVMTMIVVTLLWSIAGVVARHLDSARTFEVTFWRSAFNALTLAAVLLWRHGAAELRRMLRSGGRTLWVSGVCWSVMFSAFMLAITLTTVANVLVTMAVAPLFTALMARFALGHRLPGRTWGAIVLTGVGIGWMYGQQMEGGDATHWLGIGVALGVPIAAALNWTLMQHARARREGEIDMTPAALIGAVLSALAMLPFSWPFAGSAHDIMLLALLGSVQLALPCLLLVGAVRFLSASEIALLALLEVIFGVLLAWLGAGEAPSTAVLGGGMLVLAALAANEMLSLREQRSRS